VVRAPYIHHFLKPAPEFVPVIGEVGGEICACSVCPDHHTVFFVSKPGAPEPDRAFLVIDIPALPQEIDRLLNATVDVRTAFWGIRILDLTSGETVYETNPERFFVPASNVKLFTAALALMRLGPEYAFQTRVLAESPPDGQGRINGPLILAAGGDPNLSGRAIPYRMGAASGNPLGPLEDLAAQVAAQGVKRVQGGIIGDDSWYVWAPYPEGWATDDPQYDYGAPVSAFSINDNSVAIGIRPGARAGDPAILTLDPPVEYYRIDNRIRTLRGAEDRSIQFARDPGGLQVRLWGAIPLRSRGQSMSLAIEDPAAYAALAFKEALEARGVAVAGSAAHRHRFPNEIPDLKRGADANAEQPGVELARRTSAPLIEDLRITLKDSQNLHAEMALRAVARARRGVGSLDAGLEEMKAFLTDAGVEPETYSFTDASGLGRLNLVTPAAVVDLLRFMYNSPARDNWLSLLPIAGRDGTLSDRFGDGAAAGRIYAKTGTLTHVHAMSGYARRRDGSWLAFSILVNNANGPVAGIRGVMDRICTLMVE
jgi:D-alanyl-D-alanine carboxypeptidase/D-alanyl-D-alanine-endopeptidase (penicillin-binding protein 4)